MAVVGALVLTAVLVLSLVAKSLRSKGDIAIAIQYPQEFRGIFSIRVSRHRLPRRAVAEDSAAYDRASSRYEHNSVSRETQFHGIPSRHYFVLIEGTLEDTRTGERRHIAEEQQASVERGRVARLGFDLSPTECMVEVRVMRAGIPLPEARLAVTGKADSIRYARSGVFRLELEKGAHTLIVGGDGAVVEHTLEIESLETRQITLDVENHLELVFDGCPAAVEPYLLGDFERAGTALERAGDLKRGRVLSARSLLAKGDHDTAATQFVAAGRLFEAAQCYAEIGSFERAAALYQQAGDAAQAAELYNAAGDLFRAGRAYEEAGDLQSAEICYRDCEAIPKLIDVLEKRGECFEAGELCIDRQDKPRAARNLQQVNARHPSYERACRLLADLYVEDGKIELGLQRAEEIVSLEANAKGSADTFAWFGDILERCGQTDRALLAWEKVSEREPDREGVAERIDALRKRQSISRALGGSFSKGQGVGQEKRYELLAEIGRGGMGVVYRARDTRLGRIVALKRLPDNLKENPKAVQLFLREARSAAALNHPNIVTLHDVDEEDGVFFLTMEFLEGLTLSQILRKRGRLSTADVARLGIQAAAGLQYAHDRRIIHRDVKTANLLFTRDKVLKIMDFGLAKMLEEVRRAKTLVGGTPYYMSPEQVTGKGVDHRADLYSLGVTLFELGTGVVPFKEGDIMWHHRFTDAPDPRSRIADFDARLAALLLRTLQKDPARRPQSATEIAQELLAIAG
ncbi:MAG: protein kinase [Myxococcales bacterium]|nr:protein kinase [Myxococcales bacterium]